MRGIEKTRKHEIGIRTAFVSLPNSPEALCVFGKWKKRAKNHAKKGLDSPVTIKQETLEKKEQRISHVNRPESASSLFNLTDRLSIFSYLLSSNRVRWYRIIMRTF